MQGVSKLVENMFVEMHQMTKVHWEATYWMGHYHQSFPNEDRQQSQFIDREFTHLLNTQLRGGRFPIPMDVMWTCRVLRPGASLSGAKPEEMPLIGHPILPPPLGRPE